MSRTASSNKQLQSLHTSNQLSNQVVKESIETAFILLLENNRNEQITISDIVRKAGVSRMAYYRNYNSKEEILDSYMRTNWKTVQEAISPYAGMDDPLSCWTTLFSTIQQFVNSYLVLLNAGMGETILRFIDELFVELIPNDSNSAPVLSHFWSGATYNVLSEWIRTGMQQPPHKMAEIFCSIYSDSLR
ncbi:TetR/AcrR family transcriptional regulator [Anaerocolumna xylanovorans]|uniref:Transcriptional regulator, TetR family n=1 Tax=Anaerocolumna xylanovorans DSM 12503 TaxID=1121345 RepID=A0A1M7XXI4_9FIRM|nr:TetR/AcrR family transcriptional regulator [Anaerocolumna xylanovorans]SHO43661.1 transcriptional regulator, TetR family [Anaerocolumna xylanovorans DSM 12503]